MKRLFWLVAAMALVWTTSSAYAANLDFTIVNNTGVDIYEVYVSPSDTEEWGDDIMEEDILEAGASVDVTFEPGEESEYWDIMVTDGDGNAIYWTGFNLTQISTVTLSLDTSSSRDSE